MAKVAQPPKVDDIRFDDWLFLFWKSVTTAVVGDSTSTGATQAITGIIPVINGGTGVSNLTGYLKGNGTNPLTAVTKIPYSDITGVPAVSGDQPPVTALNQNAGTGIYVVTAYGASKTCVIVGTTSVVNVTNGDGINGNPAINIAPEYFSQQSNFLCFAAACG